MRKNKSRILSIPAPCTAEWADMSVVPGGRFCTQCQQKVIGFSTLPDSEMAFFSGKSYPHSQRH
ncbi:hypothetical protein [Chitinophaga nivalis]|uniref:Uncharacterized protein n=1 Tax=Chitinophaga nivalis TaxID=2991709 RepID=A0ABT3IWG6_9BACT|nr:hypothetical protein [Chitinophaga nivalis]MCW3462008.1 hypothetical protein [Chitinophaga nivalis]MCW3488300.1 hypothetical protein [Chitinophaga nivalis]